jgi:predicted metal-dependent hydrolase
MVEDFHASGQKESVHRLVREMPFPPYGYIPGGPFPHPARLPDGHSLDKPSARPDPPDPERWQACRSYLLGIDLFNHGFYWEAHEAWEGLWHACGRSGTVASFLKGLIKLAAAGVKVREGRPQGVRNHARRARELFSQVTDARGEGGDRFLGLSLQELQELANAVHERPPVARGTRAEPVEVVFAWVLRPS